MQSFRSYWAVVLLVAGCFPAAAQVPKSSHVVVVAEENHSYWQAKHYMPKLMDVLAKNGIAGNFYAVTHPSIGNYFDLTTGKVITNNDGWSGTITGDNLVRHLLQASVSWKVYAESLPYDGYLGGDRSPYIKHHNPVAYFSDVQSSQRWNIQQFHHFAEDISAGNLPQFSFVVPNQYHDAHNGSLGDADNWLKTYVIDRLLATPDFQPGGDGLLIVWFDESISSDSSHGGGHVLVGLIGPKVKPGYVDSNFYQHPNLMKTILKALGVSTSGLGKIGYSTTPAMAPMFQSSGSSTGSLTVWSPLDGQTFSGSLHVKAADIHATTMKIYVDDREVFSKHTQSIDTYVNLRKGDHHVVVQDWNSAGVVTKYAAGITIQ